MERQKLISKKSVRLVTLTGIAMLFIGWLGYKFFGPLSPEAVRDRTLSALEAKDAQELCQLADPEEITRLHLSPTIVANMLGETLWQEGSLQQAKLEKSTQTPNDQSVWRVHWANEKADTLNIIIPVVDDPKKGWKLSLSDLLNGACWRKRAGKEGMREYFALAQKYGIEGMRTQGGGYQSMETLAKQIANVFHE